MFSSHSANVHCDFEDPAICGYKQDKSDNFDWSRRQQGTSTGHTGPTNDHTYGTSVGMLLFISSTYLILPHFLII